ncbi:hypothetical protein ACQEVZ_24745 [Dactylosporangium sp. CA-152071]|uniref:hypothetical protein n=1 Tax=Dactylosporangium sp. CA-152071 TaxID=3239933 RepID=UPI003D8D2AAE
MTLPTPDEMLAHAETDLDRAARALTDAADWLRSDWTPVGSPLTAEQARRRTAMRAAITAASAAISQVLP